MNLVSPRGETRFAVELGEIRFSLEWIDFLTVEVEAVLSALKLLPP